MTCFHPKWVVMSDKRAQAFNIHRLVQILGSCALIPVGVRFDSLPQYHHVTASHHSPGVLLNHMLFLIKLKSTRTFFFFPFLSRLFL